MGAADRTIVQRRLEPVRTGPQRRKGVIALTELWAKLSAEPGGPYHPLLYHCLETAAVCAAMWDGVVPPVARRRFTTALGLPSDAAAQRWVAFLAGLHDMGKATPTFQGRDQAMQKRLSAMGYAFSPRDGRPPHGTATAALLSSLLTAPPCAVPPLPLECARALATVLGGHHGQFPTAAQMLPGTVLRLGRGRWETARRDLFEALARATRVMEETSGPATVAGDQSVCMLLCGLVIVADWIASSEEHFPYCPSARDPEEYCAHALGRARDVLAELGWCDWTPDRASWGFSELFEFSPRPVQQAIIEIAAQADGPGLVLVEAPMGEGKTEAAFYLADRWNTALAQRGTYVAMPTMATANAMFRRFATGYLSRRYPGQAVPLKLLHGQAVLTDKLLQLREISGVGEHEPETEPGTVSAREWFSGRKRGLLGPFAVGTIDQALQAVLQSRHVAVRLLGLADKTLILDEVHAFDVYTSGLIDRLLSWAAKLGCSAVLLSATLPAGRREQLLSAYAGTRIHLEAAPYPRITWLAAGRAQVRHVAADRARQVSLEWMDADVPALFARLREELSAGGCVGWVCNTVQSAQDTFVALSEAFADSQVDVSLFHARYPFGERDRREQGAIRRFGKDGQRPHAAILVATQVIEQSLDLDFDLLVTDLAPVDLILQRAGRMHRHTDRPRPAALQEPTVWILRPEARPDGTIACGTSRYVYGEYLLLRTWLALQDRDAFALPDDVDALIESVYGDDDAPEAPPAVAQQLDEAKLEMQKRKDTMRYRAQEAMLRPPDLPGDFQTFAHMDCRDEDNPELHHAFRAMTRYEEGPSVTVVCLSRGPDGEVMLATPTGATPVDLEAAPDETRQALLLSQSVSLSHSGVAGYFLDEPVPTGWRRTPLLRYARAAVFDADGLIATERFTLRLDPDLGIAIEYPSRKEEEG